MAKEKLFTPEDFDKPKEKGFWLKYKSWIISIAALLITAAIILCCVFCGKTERKEETEIQEQTEQVTVGAETQASNGGSVASEIVATPAGATETEQVKEQTTSPEQETKTPNEEVKQEVARPKSAIQYDKVSDNIEQEAINVIRGDYGNVPERREKLGSKYQEIQNRVNQLKKEGIF